MYSLVVPGSGSDDDASLGIGRYRQSGLVSTPHHGSSTLGEQRCGSLRRWQSWSCSQVAVVVVPLRVTSRGCFGRVAVLLLVEIVGYREP